MSDDAASSSSSSRTFAFCVLAISLGLLGAAMVRAWTEGTSEATAVQPVVTVSAKVGVALPSAENNDPVEMSQPSTSAAAEPAIDVTASSVPTTTTPVPDTGLSSTTALESPPTTTVTTTTSAPTSTTAGTAPAELAIDPPSVERPGVESVETASANAPVAVRSGVVVRTDTDGVLWDDIRHPVMAISAQSPAELWAITSTGILLGGSIEGLVNLDGPTGLGYTALAVTEQHVVAATNSGAVFAFLRASPSGSARLVEGPRGADGLALPVTSIDWLGGETLRAIAGDRVFNLSAAAGGVVLDCGPVSAPSC